MNTGAMESKMTGQAKQSEETRIMQKWRTLLAALWLGCSLPMAALAQNAIQSITSSQQAGTDVLRIELKEPLAAVPTGFAVQTPPRIAVDLPGIGNDLGRNAIDINQGNLRSVNVAQAGERTRLVLMLRQPANYVARLDGKALVLVLGSGEELVKNLAAATAPTPPAAKTVAAEAQAAPAVTPFAPSQNAQSLDLRDIDFRRGQDGAGRVLVTLPSTQVGVDIRQQGKGLVVEFQRTQLPEALRRRLDVTDFGTPVLSVSSFQSGDNVRMVVEPSGDWEHSAYQTDNQFVLEVRKVRSTRTSSPVAPAFRVKS